MGRNKHRGGGNHGGGPAKRGRFMRRDFKDGRSNEWKRSEGDAQKTAPWKPFTYENEAFETYYKTQKIVDPEEWDQFVQIMRTPLPTTFRINGSGRFAYEIRDQMQRDFFDFLNEKMEVDGEVLEPPHPLPWYPENLAWHLSFSRMQLRKLPILAKVFEFMKRENAIGSITRQEAVSMVPPLLLDVEPHHYVLDMCAAPGSKTFQLLEMLHKGNDATQLPTGLVVANDVDVQRCHLLIHQTQRMCSPSILVTNHEAQLFPSLRPRSENLEGIPGSFKDGLLFDRILCDVPCSGDGTMRKAPDIWRKWNAAIGNGLHPLQVRIAMRAVALLKVGGRLIYSTCSLNPIEDEAVVAQVLRESGGSMELLESSHLLPELKRRPGVRTWKVKDRKSWYTSFHQVDTVRSHNILPSMFPSGKTDFEKVQNNSEQNPSKEGEEGSVEKDVDGKIAEGDEGGVGGEGGEVDVKTQKEEVEVSEEEAEISDLPLERCLRIVPHDQDTGGFFVAVLRKVAPLTAPPQLSSRDRQRIERRDGPKVENIEGVEGEGKQSGGEKVPETQGEKSPMDTGDGNLVMEMETNLGKGEEVLNSTEEVGLSLEERETEMVVKEGEEEEEKNVLGEEVMEDVGDIGGVSGLEKDKEGEVLVKEYGDLPPEVIISEKGEEGEEGGEEKEGGGGEEGGEGGEGVGQETGQPESQKGSRRVQQQGRWRGVDPVLILKDEGVLNSIESYYGMSPSSTRGHLVTRSEDIARAKRIYYVSKAVSDIVSLNFQTGQHLKMVSAGLKAFERQTLRENSSPCAFRITSEGLPGILPHLTKQIIPCSLSDFCLLLSRRSLRFAEFENPELVKAFESSLLGCLVLTLQSEEHETFPGIAQNGAQMAVGVWRGKTSLSLLVTKEESQQMLDRLKKPENSLSDGNTLPPSSVETDVTCTSSIEKPREKTTEGEETKGEETKGEETKGEEAKGEEEMKGEETKGVVMEA